MSKKEEEELDWEKSSKKKRFEDAKKSLSLYAQFLKQTNDTECCRHLSKIDYYFLFYLIFIYLFQLLIEYL